MIEVSITEIVLFAWASIATGMYFKIKHEEHMVRKLFMHLIENKEARDEMVRQFEMAQQRGDV
jgi:protease II